MERLEEEGLDGLFVGPSGDLLYLVGLDLFQDERCKGLMVSRKGCFGLVPLLYRQEMGRHMEGVPLFVWDDRDGFAGAFGEGCRSLGLEGEVIGINCGMRAVDLIDAQGVLKARYVNGAKVLDPMRRVKSPEELALMRKASGLADLVMDKVYRFLRPGLSERRVKEFILKSFDELGTVPSFDPIVAFGANASMPHYGGGDAVGEEGDCAVLDFGCRVGGYCSDMTRTFFLGGVPDESAEVYRVVLESQLKGIGAVRPLVAAQEVDRAARDVIARAGYGEHFLNRLGHGIGLEVHEGPYIVEGNDTPLEVGNVFSVEPGIYIPGKLGVRIEDLVAVGEAGAEVLNSFPKELMTTP
ncbi:LOW QUALITY PROTEIN: Xaa-Pro aminopeptidase [Thermanaerovibrio velox DSM 12556]|uniref:Xaa-Pro aminopeptidase n=2 Tax=Thermanaerovibrio TaxID=81461 RepID=H0UQL5_9BACT|nr:LOW QUALITY PROTEIN: Xaa-Pro aminopeptidase [Thermanaerovibrio velox DSM 12556]